MYCAPGYPVDPNGNSLIARIDALNEVRKAQEILETKKWMDELNKQPINPDYKDAPIKVTHWDGAVLYAKFPPKGYWVFHDPAEEIDFSA